MKTNIVEGLDPKALAQCPFCGAKLVLVETGVWVHPWEENCPADALKVRDDDEVRKANWNRRALAASPSVGVRAGPVAWMNVAYGDRSQREFHRHEDAAISQATFINAVTSGAAKVVTTPLYEQPYPSPDTAGLGSMGEAWQTMDTAQKDGTMVDLWGSRNGTPRRFTEAKWLEIGMWGTGDPTGEFRWVFPAWDMYGEFEFTHWRPLPSPPVGDHNV